MHNSLDTKVSSIQTLTRDNASSEKSQAWTKSLGYAATRGNIVFPAPQPICHPSIKATKLQSHNQSRNFVIIQVMKHDHIN